MFSYRINKKSFISLNFVNEKSYKKCNKNKLLDTMELDGLNIQVWALIY